MHDLQSLNTAPPTAPSPQSISSDMKRQEKEKKKEEADSSQCLRSRARIVPAGEGGGVLSCLIGWMRGDVIFNGSEGPCSGKATRLQVLNVMRRRPPCMNPTCHTSDIPDQKRLHIKRGLYCGVKLA